jgi:iron complex outermembrane receptor protein
LQVTPHLDLVEFRPDVQRSCGSRDGRADRQEQAEEQDAGAVHLVVRKRIPDISPTFADLPLLAGLRFQDSRSAFPNSHFAHFNSSMKGILLTAMLVAFSTLLLQGQQATVTGQISDAESGETLIGVNILELNSQTGASTDENGKYRLSLPAGEAILRITYVGYEKEEYELQLAAGQSQILNITLQAESRLMDQVVVTGSKFEKKLGEETVSMEIIRPQQLENINAVRVDDAIARVPGVNVLDGQVNIRGGAGYSYGAGTRVLLLYNDMPILQADAGFPNWSAVPIENIGQVEIIKGAASALYGSSAINGIINLRSAEPVSKPFFQIASFGTLYNNPRNNVDSTGAQKAFWRESDTIQTPHQAGLSVAYRKKFGRLDVTAGGYFYKEESFRQGEFDNRARVSLLTRYRVAKVEGLSIGLNLNAQVGESGSFFIWNGTGTEAYKSWELIGLPTRTDALRLTIDPFLTYFDDRGNRHRVQLRYNQVDNDNTNNQGNFSKYYYGEYQYQRQFEDIDLTLTMGGVANAVTVTADLYADSVRVDNEFVQVGDPLNGSNFAGYAQLDKKFFNTLNITVGGRLEANKISFTDAEQKFVFRAGANYQAAEYTFIRASWGQGYRFPTIAEKFIQTNLGGGPPSPLTPVVAPNPELVSETGWNSEIGIKQGLRVRKFDMLVDVSVFYQEYLSMMEFTFFQQGLLSGFQSRNIGDTRIYGTELTLGGTGKLGKHPISLMGGYTYVKPEYQEFTPELDQLSSCDGNILSYRNQHTFKAESEITLGVLTLGTNLQYYSYMECIDAIFEILLPGVAEFREQNNSGDWIWDLRAGVNIGEHINITGIVKNVMNREYAIRPARIDAPRNYTLRVSYTL